MFSKCQGYAEFWIFLNVWIIPKYAWLSLNMPEHIGICQNTPNLPKWLFFTFPLCNNLSTWTSGYLLNDTRHHSLVSRRDKICFFLSSWEYLIYFLYFRLNVLLVRFRICCCLWGSKGPGVFIKSFTWVVPKSHKRFMI